MNKIDEIALRVAAEMPCVMNHIPIEAGVIWSQEDIISFAHTLLAELSKDVEPVATVESHTITGMAVFSSRLQNWLPHGTKLFTHPVTPDQSEIEQKPIARVDANDDCCWADILPDNDVIIGQLLYATPPNTAEIEQRTAEAFLKALNGKLAHTFGHDCADALKANWREYL